MGAMREHGQGVSKCSTKKKLKGENIMETTKQEKIALAQEILNQLGGHKFVVMTGARSIFALDNGLCFKLAGTMTINHINYVKIMLNSMDTYDVELWNLRRDRYEPKLISEHRGVYNDMLQGLLRDKTGLAVSL
jgi:hypothetical protein